MSRSHPRTWNPANNLSLLRIVLVPLFVASLIYYSPERDFLRLVSVALFALACITDAVDGYLARRFKQVTVFGTYVDPLADKLLILSGFLCLSFIGSLPPAMHIPAWVTLSVVTRDFIILGGAAVIFIITGKLKADPLFIGKITTVSQMLTLFVSLAAAPFPVRLFLYSLTFTITLVSGIQYIRMGGRLLQS